MNEKLAEAIKTGKVLISKPALERLEQLSVKDQQTIYEAVARCEGTCRLSYSREPASENVVVKEMGKPSAKAMFPLMPIKQMPAFDPDAEIMSLAYTIPSWMDSIRRKCENTDFLKTSDKAREILLYDLKGLTAMTASIIQIIEEVDQHGR